MDAPESCTLIRVTGLHKLPLDEERFEQDYVSVDGHDGDEQLRRQFRENWENAWLVVFETSERPEQINFGAFSYGQSSDSMSNQAAWNEAIVESRDSSTLAAFYLHYVQLSGRLWYRGREVNLPIPTPPPIWLWDRVPYVSPD